MLADTFSHGMIRNYVVAFGTLFNNIKINRRAAGGGDADTIAVPLAYAPRQRYIERITEDANLDRPVAMTLPRMSFEMVSMTYSTERKLNTMQRFARPKTTANTKLDSMYSPVPYDFTFQLNIYIGSIEDGTHIVEQILPYFTPEFTLGLKGVTDMGIPMDLPIILNSVAMEDSYEGGFDDRRIIIWTMDFTLKGNLYGPISKSGIINKIFVNLYPSMNLSAANTTAERVITQPGQFANGTPTTDAALSVTPNLINANSDFGISQEIFGPTDDPNIHKIWDFNDTSTSGGYETVTFGPATGNNKVDGWETYESFPNGTVGLSVSGGKLKHTITKYNPGSEVDNQENVTIQIYANTTGYFEPFYGKNYKNVQTRFKVQQTNGSGGGFSGQPFLRWLTTNSDEDVEWTTSSSDPPGNRFDKTGSTYAYDGEYYTVDFDMEGKTTWEDRVINALRIEYATATDSSGDATFETDIDYIKVYANTT